MRPSVRRLVTQACASAASVDGQAANASRVAPPEHQASTLTVRASIPYVPPSQNAIGASPVASDASSRTPNHSSDRHAEASTCGNVHVVPLASSWNTMRPSRIAT
jgi:hypothetical protein